MTDPDAVPDTFTIKAPSRWVSAELLRITHWRLVGDLVLYCYFAECSSSELAMRESPAVLSPRQMAALHIQTMPWTHAFAAELLPADGKHGLQALRHRSLRTWFSF